MSTYICISLPSVGKRVTKYAFIVLVTLLSLSIIPRFALADSVPDQGQIFSTGGDVWLDTNSWNQSITTGIEGKLTGIQFQIHNTDALPEDFEFTLYAGDNPPTGLSVFSQRLTITETDVTGPGLYTWDVSSANLLFDVGDLFTFGFEAQNSGIELAGNDPPGYAGGELFKNGSALPTSEANDLAFITYVDPAQTVAIDIKPYRDPNALNVFDIRKNKRNEKFWVAILSDTDFDALQVNPKSVRFGRGEATPLRYKVNDVNRDGFDDLLLRFKNRKAKFECGDAEVGLTGRTYDGQSIIGTDFVRIVVCPDEKVIRIEAIIDGRSNLILHNNKAQWHHINWAAPGRLDFSSDPTIINGDKWYPVWPDVPDEENRSCDCFSDVFKSVKPTLPKKNTNVDLILIQSRGETAIVQYPSKKNGYELILEYNDNPFGGSDTYIVDLRFSRTLQ